MIRRQNIFPKFGVHASVCVVFVVHALACVVVTALLLTLAPGAHAAMPDDTGTIDPTATQFPRAALTDKTDATIPLDTQLFDEDGHPVKLGDYFHPDRPVILVLVYYQCPNYCTMVLNDLVQTVKRMNTLQLGQQYEIVAVSFNPNEKPALAKAKKTKYMNLLALPTDPARPQIDAAWHFLTGPDEPVRKLADTVGFGYQWNEAGGQYIHPTALFICTPQGRLSRMIPGLGYQHDDSIDLVRDSLINASAGHIGSPIIRAAWLCGAMKYNPVTGRYEQNPWFYAATLGGVVSLITLGMLATWMWRLEKKRRHAPGPIAG